MRDDHDNIELIESREQIDAANADFYAKYPYPWPPLTFESVKDPVFWETMVCQEIGDWDTTLFTEDQPSIWVAGCGTNQAVITALRFPRARVVGSDLSRTSLDIADRNAKQLGIKNLELRQQSINEIRNDEKYDYVVCTGVIHHNADPSFTLRQLAKFLRPNGLLELMVYNYYHSTMTVAYQKAMRVLGRASASGETLALARAVLADCNLDEIAAGPMSVSSKKAHDSALADLLLQPVWRSYTVESLAALCEDCNLTILAPCVNQFDLVAGSSHWSLDFASKTASASYDALSDLDRWQVTNLLMREKSPMLWFYIQRKDADRSRKPERQIADEFLSRRAVATATRKVLWTRNPRSDVYVNAGEVSFPGTPSEPMLLEVYEAIQRGSTISDVFRELEISQDFNSANKIRTQLATPANPYIRVGLQ